MFLWICFNGAEVRKLVGSYILKQLSQLFEKHSVEIYRDDGLIALKGLSGPEIEKVKKKFKVFKGCGITITIKAK